MQYDFMNTGRRNQALTHCLTYDGAQSGHRLLKR